MIRRHILFLVALTSLILVGASAFFLLGLGEEITGNAVDSGIPQTQLTPIARWDAIPYQRIDASNPLNVAVVAFSKYGIREVVFIVKSSDGQELFRRSATQMALNPQTGVWEYWTTLKASDFLGNQVITVEAEVYGNDGGVRTKDSDGAESWQGLDPLNFVVVSTAEGSWQRAYAWVSPNGDDSIGTGGIQTIPSDPGAGNYFRTPKGAAVAIQSYRGGNADGGVIYLKEGTYAEEGNTEEINTLNEWLTVGAAPGVSRDKVHIDGKYTISNIDKLKVSGFTMSYVDGYAAQAGNYLWSDNNAMIGSGHWSPWTPEVTWATGAVNPCPEVMAYWTNGRIENANWALGNCGRVGVARNMEFYDVSDDVIQQSSVLGINLKVNGQWGKYEGPHSDLLQPGSGWNNVILYNVRAEDMHYQGLFLNCWGGEICKNTAIVNTLIQMSPPSDSEWRNTPFEDVSAGWIRGNFEHLLIWQSTFVPLDPPNVEQEHPDFVHDVHILPVEGDTFEVKYSSIRGNLFNAFWTQPSGGGYQWWTDPTNEVIDNHFSYGWGPLTLDARDSTGEPGIEMNRGAEFGKPLSTSKLARRISSPPVPADIDGNPRPLGGATVGAFEVSTGTSCASRFNYYSEEPLEFYLGESVIPGLRIEVLENSLGIMKVEKTSEGEHVSYDSEIAYNLYPASTTNCQFCSFQYEGNYYAFTLKKDACNNFLLTEENNGGAIAYSEVESRANAFLGSCVGSTVSGNGGAGTIGGTFSPGSSPPGCSSLNENDCVGTYHTLCEPVYVEEERVIPSTGFSCTGEQREYVQVFSGCAEKRIS